jgi:hypothetical protein
MGMHDPRLQPSFCAVNTRFMIADWFYYYEEKTLAEYSVKVVYE